MTKNAPNRNGVVELCTMNNTEREGEGRRANRERSPGSYPS